MTATYSIELPFPPSVNHYWRHQNGRHHISAQGVAYRKEVWAICKQLRVRPLPGELAVRIEAYPPDKRRRDLDNMLKAALDACTHGGIWVDDSQISHLQIVRMPQVKGGKIILFAGIDVREVK